MEKLDAWATDARNCPSDHHPIALQGLPTRPLSRTLIPGTDYCVMPLVFPMPPLAPLTAHVLAITFAGAYVGSIYLSKHARLAGRPRDDPAVIKARLRAVALATLACCAAIVAVLAALVPAHTPHVSPPPSPGNSALTTTGTQRTAAILDTARVRLGLTLAHLRPAHFLLTPLLFLGPLSARALAAPSYTALYADAAALAREAGGTWVGARNLLVAPLTEEAVFRACVLAAYQLAGLGRGAGVGASPLAFGLAHVHHAWEVWTRYGRTPAAARRAAISSTVQLAYTTAFGAYTALLFLRTGSLLPPLAAHAWCNALGLPSLAGDLAAVTPPEFHPTRTLPRTLKTRVKRGTVRVCYVVGLLGFVFALRGWGEAWLGVGEGEESLYWARFVRRREGTVVFY
ncbi:hypothetical protein HWV62_37881 [Athelia sp. TMB]|nr:hypothetical protein HWV62_37881 [Athelia sp. TMB]